jgi:fructoselysine 6-phosphate deglycase
MVDLPSDIDAALALMRERAIAHVYLVACGGSLSIMHAGKYLLDRHAAALSSDIYNSDEFVHRDPRKLDAKALVIVCSQTGTTRETLRAAEHARAKGACVIAMTLDLASPLARAADCAVAYKASYTTGIPIDAAESNYAVLYQLLAGLLGLREGADLLPRLTASLSHLQAVIDRAHEHYRAVFDAFAPRHAHSSAIYTLASGPAYGAAYSFAICVLMEMQRYNSQAIHANEFFHGPFEVVDKEACFIALIGADETRPLAERARDFLLHFGSPERVLVLDAAELDLGGLDPQLAGYFVPLLFFDVLWKFAYELAALRHIPMLEGRRYMKKISDY